MMMDGLRSGRLQGFMMNIVKYNIDNFKDKFDNHVRKAVFLKKFNDANLSTNLKTIMKREGREFEVTASDQ